MEEIRSAKTVGNQLQDRKAHDTEEHSSHFKLPEIMTCKFCMLFPPVAGEYWDSIMKHVSAVSFCIIT
jgi:hypothetical protein